MSIKFPSHPKHSMISKKGKIVIKFSLLVLHIKEVNPSLLILLLWKINIKILQTRLTLNNMNISVTYPSLV